MLLKNEFTPDTNYLADWPIHYYEMEDINLRQQHLLYAIEQQLDTAHDSLRLTLLQKRFGTSLSEKRPDLFLRAWMMIKAGSASGTSFLNKKHQKKELLNCLETLGILDCPTENSAALQVLTEEWQNFAHVFLANCAGSKSYCSTLFGMIPIKDSVVAEKIAIEIDLVTRTYPARFGLEEQMLPFRKVMADIYCKRIENGSIYWDKVTSSHN